MRAAAHPPNPKPETLGASSLFFAPPVGRRTHCLVCLVCVYALPFSPWHASNPHREGVVGVSWGGDWVASNQGVPFSPPYPTQRRSGFGECVCRAGTLAAENGEELGSLKGVRKHSSMPAHPPTAWRTRAWTSFARHCLSNPRSLFSSEATHISFFLCGTSIHFTHPPTDSRLKQAAPIYHDDNNDGRHATHRDQARGRRRSRRSSSSRRRRREKGKDQ